MTSTSASMAHYWMPGLRTKASCARMVAAIRRMTTAATQAGTLQGKSAVTPTHESTTDPDARLARKSDGDASRLCYMGHVLMENRNGLVVDVSVSTATGMAEREESLKLLQANTKSGATIGEDRGYDVDTHIKAVQALGVIPHVAAKRKDSAVPHDIRQSGRLCNQSEDS